MKTYKFRAKIEASDGGGAYVLFPYDSEAEFSTKGKVPVKATLEWRPLLRFPYDVWWSASHARGSEGDPRGNRQTAG